MKGLSQRQRDLIEAIQMYVDKKVIHQHWNLVA